MQNIYLSVQHVTAAYQDHIVLWNVSFDLAAGTLLGIIGPNGAGKSTLLKSMVDIIKPLSGAMYLNGNPIHTMKHNISYVPQRVSVDWDFPINVFDVIMMGRYRYLSWLRSPCSYDKDRVWLALEQMALLDVAYQPISELSGGQQQRVFIARTLVQDADVLLFDEPFNNVDAASEHIIIQLLKKLRDEGKTILVVHHDFQTLAQYFDTLLLLKTNKIAFGSTSEVLKPEYICSAYGDRTLFTYR